MTTDLPAIVARWQARMGLSDWHIRVKLGPITGGHRATCEAMPEYPEATLCFDPDAMDQAGDDADLTVQHELAHVFGEELSREALDLAGMIADGKVRGAAKRRIGRYEERATGMIQRALKAAYEAGKAGL